MSKPEKAYPIRLAGARSYAEAVAGAGAGEPVRILHEAGNPYDPDALVVVDAFDQTLGYVPRGNWVRRALVDEGRGCRATVEAAVDGGVTIAVVLTDDGAIGSRDFVPAK